MLNFRHVMVEFHTIAAMGDVGILLVAADHSVGGGS